MPLPTDFRASYNFNDMEVGDSFDVPHQKKASAQASASRQNIISRKETEILIEEAIASNQYSKSELVKVIEKLHAKTKRFVSTTLKDGSCRIYRTK